MSDLKLFNSFTKQVEVFKPINPDQIGMYVCGPTVYDYAHIGNARAFVVFDVLYRLLKVFYPKPGQVKYVRNITDIDDKIMKAAHETGKSITEITIRTNAAFQQDMQDLGNLAPDLQPKATEYIPQMLDMIGKLVDKGHAYAAEGHVLFHVPSMKNYGGLSKLDLEQLINGARVEAAPYKRDPTDFILWKPSTPDQPGWESPWGFGRPGWHIECSAMSLANLGAVFDIHGGGLDLIFPHHENEIAQSCCANDTPKMANYWVHNGYLTMSGEKMSKSLGNIAKAHDLLKEWPGEVLRYALLSAHYKQPLDFSDDLLKQSKSSLDRLYGALQGPIAETQLDLTAAPAILALANDINTPSFFAALFEAAGEIHREKDEGKKAALRSSLKQQAAAVGLLQQDPEQWFKQLKGDQNQIDAAAIEQLIKDRAEARAAKNFALADQIRQKLDDLGVVLEDKAGVTGWRFK